jgi:hypothetical protein
MLKHCSKSSVLLFAAVVAASAMAAPSLASASSWGVVGTTHVLDATSYSTNIAALGVGTACFGPRIHLDVDSPQIVTITGITFGHCTGTGGGLHCTVTKKATSLPWVITVPTPTTITLHNYHVDTILENIPGDPTACATPTFITEFGSIHLGVWDSSAHQITYTNAPGSTAAVSGLGTFPQTVSATLRDTTQTLTVN